MCTPAPRQGYTRQKLTMRRVVPWGLEFNGKGSPLYLLEGAKRHLSLADVASFTSNMAWLLRKDSVNGTLILVQGVEEIGLE